LGFSTLHINWAEQKFYETYGGRNQYAYGNNVQQSEPIEPFHVTNNEPF